MNLSAARTKRDVLLVIVGLVAASGIILMDVWAYNHDWILAYGDAASHLAISRRVVDNLTPGFGQLGSSWLPAMHLLMLPLIWIDPLWHSGLAGTVVSNLAYIGAAMYCYLLARMITEHRGIALAATLTLFSNPNLMYMSTTAMNESLYVFTVIASATHLLLWHRRPNQMLHLVLGAFFAFMTAFNRYEGWFLVMGQAAGIWLVTFKLKGKKYAVGMALLFAYIAFFAPFLWLGWNLLIFGDALEFLHNEYTSRGQQLDLELGGRLPTKGNMVVAAAYFYRSMIYMLGSLPSTLALLTALLLLPLLPPLRRRTGDGYDPYSDVIVGYTLLVPGFFLIYTLVKGITALHLPEVTPFRIYNIRYGLFVFPAVAFFLFYGLRLGYRLWKPLAPTGLAIIAVGVVLVWRLPWMSLEEGKDNLANNVRRFEAINIVSQYYQEFDNPDDPPGGILISVGAGAGNTFIQRSRLPMKSYIHEGNQDIWDEALKKPEKHAEWVVIQHAERGQPSRDKIAARLLENPKLLDSFDLVYKDGGLELYHLRPKVARVP